MPEAAKWQIVLFVGFLEFFSESAGTHYMRGGQPGKFPEFSSSDLIPHPMPLNLFDPFGFSKNASAEKKEKGLISELNNGRLAQIGILGFLAEQKVAGSVPLLTGIVAPYSGKLEEVAWGCECLPHGSLTLVSSMYQVNQWPPSVSKNVVTCFMRYSSSCETIDATVVGGREKKHCVGDCELTSQRILSNNHF